MKETFINIRVDEKLKKDADRVFKKMGMDTSVAVRMFLLRTVKDGMLPFQPTARNRTNKPNQETVENSLALPKNMV